MIIESVYGDLLVWKQIIDKAHDDNVPIIFVTGDVKDDWWQEIKGKKIGANSDLINEFKYKTNQTFHMYQPERFIEYAQSYLKQQTSEATISEIKNIQTNNSNKENYHDIELYYTVKDASEKLVVQAQIMFAFSRYFASNFHFTITEATSIRGARMSFPISEVPEEKQIHEIANKVFDKWKEKASLVSINYELNKEKD